MSKKMVCLYLFALLSLNHYPALVAQNSRSSSKKEINAYDYQTILQTKLSELPNEIIKKIMLQRLNEIRALYKITPLKYNSDLESLADNFATEKTGSEWRKDPYMHFDKDSLGIIDRAKKENIRFKINPHVVDQEVMGLGECLVGTNGTIEEMLSSLMKSPGHKRWLLNPYVTRVGFGYDKGYNILVQIFADFKK